jgi:hypothetical protein
MIIRAPDADTAASRADRPVTSSPHGVIAEEGNSFVLYDLGAEVCYHRTATRSHTAKAQNTMPSFQHFELLNTCYPPPRVVTRVAFPDLIAAESSCVLTGGTTKLYGC